MSTLVVDPEAASDEKAKDESAGLGVVLGPVRTQLAVAAVFQLLGTVARIRAVEGVESTETFMYLGLRKQTYAWGTRRTGAAD